MDIGDVAPLGAEDEPAQELTIDGGLSNPRAQPVEPLVDTEVERDDLVPQDLAGSRAAEVANDLRVTVQIEQVIDIVLGELADRQSRVARMMRTPRSLMTGLG